MVAVKMQAGRRVAGDAGLGDVSCLSWPRVLLVVHGETQSSSCRNRANSSHVLRNYHLTSERSLSNTFEAERRSMAHTAKTLGSCRATARRQNSIFSHNT